MAKIPFDIKYRPQIESGEYKIETKDHHPVRIICWNKNTGGLDRIVALVAGDSGQEKTLHYTEEGLCVATGSNRDKDLFIVTLEPEMSEMEIRLLSWLSDDTSGEIPMERMKQLVKARAAELLSIAREQFIKNGYVIEKKAFHDAVEKIDDKHKAEMSIEYSLHCKIENGTRHAVMNWKEFQKLAQKFIDIGKAEALKDLPRWKKAVQSFGNYTVALTETGEYCLLIDGYFIMLSDIEKLPGFKEDEK